MKISCFKQVQKITMWEQHKRIQKKARTCARRLNEKKRDFLFNWWIVWQHTYILHIEGLVSCSLTVITTRNSFFVVFYFRASKEIVPLLCGAYLLHCKLAEFLSTLLYQNYLTLFSLSINLFLLVKLANNFFFILRKICS